MRHVGWMMLLAALTAFTVGCGGDKEKEAAPDANANADSDNGSDGDDVAANENEEGGDEREHEERGQPEADPEGTDSDPVAVGGGEGEPTQPIAGVNDGAKGRPATGKSAEETVREAIAAFRANEPIRVWNMLPPSYQSRIDGVVHDYAAKMPEKAWNRGFGALGKVLGVLKNKKELIRANPLVALAGGGGEEFSQQYDATVGVLGVFVESDLGNLEALRTKSTGELLQSLNADMFAKITELAPSLPENPLADSKRMFDSIEVETVGEGDDAVVLSITGDFKTATVEDGQFVEGWERRTEEVEFVLVEGAWVPKDFADGFDAAIAEARKGLEELDQDQIDQAAAFVVAQLDEYEPIVDELAAAEDQDAFNAGVDRAMQKVQLAMGALMGPGGPGGPGLGGPPFGGGGPPIGIPVRPGVGGENVGENGGGEGNPPAVVAPPPNVRIPTEPSAREGTPQYVVEWLRIKAANGDQTGLEDYVSPDAEGILGRFRDGKLDETEILKLRSAFAVVQLAGAKTLPNGSRLFVLQNQNGQVIQILLRRQRGKYLVTEMSATAPGAAGGGQNGN